MLIGFCFLGLPSLFIFLLVSRNVVVCHVCSDKGSSLSTFWFCVENIIVEILVKDSTGESAF